MWVRMSLPLHLLFVSLSLALAPLYHSVTHSHTVHTQCGVLCVCALFSVFHSFDSLRSLRLSECCCRRRRSRSHTVIVIFNRIFSDSVSSDFYGSYLKICCLIRTSFWVIVLPLCVFVLIVYFPYYKYYVL